MSTNSLIAYETPKGKILGAYCHWDGYPSNNGKILLKNYNTLEKVKALVDEGDMSSLGAKCDKPAGHDYATPVEGYTIYFGRDRGEKGVGVRKYKDMADFMEDAEAYTYLFTKEGKWVYSEQGGDFVPLTKAKCKE